ncbi:MAG TPA: zincin-like metallopeptidase domain-containing protein [Verrucomicrobiota bacterium]|nr:zincin-like metallopeptidase domain-containing protein [Verrucomicrobiota bacterium]HQL79905.1 zincin-like metallopeptidase domain-containing protein [Verrucomicrobiota bacterium]
MQNSRSRGGRPRGYTPFTDTVGMPARSQFHNEHSYYATHFHELIHSTGHPSRLNRFSIFDTASPHGDHYAREELVAELGAAYLCAETGIANETLKDSAAYLASWIKALKAQNATLFWAASNAQKASDWILNRRPAGKAAGEPPAKRTMIAKSC